MATTKEAFDDFDAELNLAPTERENAIRRHREVTDVLIADGVAGATFLQGSFARKTMPKPLKDVDIVVVLHESHRSLWSGDGQGGPAAAMGALQSVIKSHWSDAQFDVDGRSEHALQVKFSDREFTIDLVPAFEDLDHDEDVFIADRGLDRWERSNTRTLRRIISERNQDTSGVFVHQVRMAKAFKMDHPAISKLCSLVIESLCFQAIPDRASHDAALVRFFETAAIAVQGPILDPTGVDDLSKEWTSSERNTFHQAFEAAAVSGREALTLSADGEHQAAIEIWASVVGEHFPVPAQQSESEALTMLQAGSITSLGRAISSPRGTQPNRPARSWRTH